MNRVLYSFFFGRRKFIYIYCRKFGKPKRKSYMRENNAVLKYFTKWCLGVLVRALGTVDLGTDGFLVGILMELCT